jgi:hypothetical protein
VNKIATPPTNGWAAYVAESRGNPLGAFSALRREDRPYNLWLTEQLLDPLLARWRAPREEGAGGARAVASDFVWISEGCRRAFRDLLPAVISAGDPALLAVLGVTANLQRTAAVLGEFIARGGHLAPGPVPRSLVPFRLSRLWCGLIEYPERTPYFPARIHPPVHASRLNHRRRDSRHLANALWCSPPAITARCEEATLRLRDAIRHSGLFEPGDLQHLRGPSISLRSRERR